MSPTVDVARHVATRSSTGIFMNSDLEKAKKMFFAFDCNAFFMFKEGADQEYKRFGVSKKQEREWRQEYIDFWVSQLSPDDLEGLAHLRNASAREALPVLMEMAEQGDSYTKFWFAFTILALATSSLLPHRRGREFALRLFKSLIEEKVVLSQKHKEEIDPFMMQALEASTPEGYIVNYSKRLYQENTARKGFLW